jgi:hypothetical protein
LEDVVGHAWVALLCVFAVVGLLNEIGLHRANTILAHLLV